MTGLARCHMLRSGSLSFPTRIYLLALALRLLPVAFSLQLPIGLDDMFQYDMLARSILSGEGYRWYGQEDLDLVRSYVDIDEVVGEYDPRGVLTSFRAPGYPVFLAAIYGLSGLQWRFFAARLANAFLMASLAPLGFVLAKRLFPQQERAGRWAAFALAFYPMFVAYPLALVSENLFIPLVYAGFWLLLRAVETHRPRDYLLAGAIFGAAILTRSVIFVFVGLAILWLWFSAQQKRGAKLFMLAVMVMILPWVLRNSLLHGQPTFIENSLGYNLYIGYHPKGSGTISADFSLDLFPYFDDRVRNELGLQAWWAFVRENPERVPTLMLRKLGHFFALERRGLTYFYTNGFFGPIAKIPLLGLFLLFTLPFTLLSTLSAAALALMHWTKERLLLLLLLGGYLLPHVLLLAEPRFHLTIVPALAALAGYAWMERALLWANARQNRGRILMAGLLILLLWSNWGLELWRDADKLALLFSPDGYHAGFAY